MTSSCKPARGRPLCRWLALSALFAAPAGSAAAPIMLDVDTRDVQHGIQHAHVTLPATSGAMGVVYPKWIQGEHSPSGPIVQLTGLKFVAGARTLAWTRDPLDPWRFRVSVPEGITAIEADFDYLSPPVGFNDSYGGTPGMTPHVAIVLFNHVLLLPDAADASTLPVRARVRIPGAWAYDAPTRGERPEPELVVLPERTAAALVDAPLFAGEVSRTIELTTQAPATRMTVFADAAADLAVKDDDIARWRRLVH